MNTVKQNIVEVLQGKKVLFLENDCGLGNGLDQIEELFKEKGVNYKCLFELSTLSFEAILKAIKECDAIVFQTQWNREISGKLSEYFFASQDKKIIIECYISEPTWYYKPDAVHDVYIAHPPIRPFKSSKVDESKWKFFKLSEKPYWDYENNFDK